MNWMLSRTWFVGIGWTVMSAALGCSTESGEMPQEPSADISPQEAKSMVLRFLSHPECAHQFGTWVTHSRKLVEKDSPTRMASGNIIVGPWVVTPATGRVHLGIDRADLDGSFVKEGGVYVIKDVEITEIVP